MTDIFNVLKYETNLFKDFRRNKKLIIYKHTKEEKFDEIFPTILIAIFWGIGFLATLRFFKPYSNLLLFLTITTIVILLYGILKRNLIII
ncbi:hypothetical protein HYT56_05115 [Candidatus Woesearchaeota archaeon]|nr:hypothetical protein [Candidatus Woesearchaeota archaeon]